MSWRADVLHDEGEDGLERGAERDLVVVRDVGLVQQVVRLVAASSTLVCAARLTCREDRKRDAPLLPCHGGRDRRRSCTDPCRSARPVVAPGEPGHVGRRLRRRALGVGECGVDELQRDDVSAEAQVAGEVDRLVDAIGGRPRLVPQRAARRVVEDDQPGRESWATGFVEWSCARERGWVS